MKRAVLVVWCMAAGLMAYFDPPAKSFGPAQGDPNPSLASLGADLDGILTAGNTMTASQSISSEAGADVALTPFAAQPVTVTLDGGAALTVTDTAGGTLTITPADAAESVTIATVGASSDLTIAAVDRTTLAAGTGNVTVDNLSADGSRIFQLFSGAAATGANMQTYNDSGVWYFESSEGLEIEPQTTLQLGTASTGSVTVDTAGAITLDSTTTTVIELGATSEQLTLTGGSNTITLDAGTGAALTIGAALGVTITTSGGNVALNPSTGVVDVLAEFLGVQGATAAEVYVDNGSEERVTMSVDAGGNGVLTCDSAALTIGSALDTTLSPQGGDVRLTDGTRLVAGSTTTHTIALCGLVTLADNVDTQVASFATSDGTWVGATVHFAIECTDGTEYQQRGGMLTIQIVDDVGGVMATVTEVGSGIADSSGAGTLADAWSITTTDDGDLELMLTANSSLVPTTLRVRLQIVAPTLQLVAIP